jgi:O-antigen ligase
VAESNYSPPGTSLAKIVNWLALSVWLACLNASAILEYDQFPSLETFSSRGWQLAILNIFLLVLIVFLFFREDDRETALLAWWKHVWLVIFLVLAGMSLSWSVYPKATVYEFILLITATFGASYFAVRFKPKGALEILTWFAGISTILSLFLVGFTPTGIMQGEGHAGSWRGLFWHRNHTGSLMAFFNMLFLFRYLLEPALDRCSRLIYVGFYILTAVHVFGSRSATGIIIFFFLNLLGLVSFLWFRLREKLKAVHYYTSVVFFSLALILVLANRQVIFGLLGRSATMTGRTLMWPDLLYEDFMERPIFGHGFGAIWMQDGYRVEVQERWGWSYQPYFSDNGYIDLALNLGLIGLVVFVWGAGCTIFTLLHCAKKDGSWYWLIYFAMCIYVLIANITYSFLFEVDYFVWSLLILSSFLVMEARFTKGQLAYRS